MSRPTWKVQKQKWGLQKWGQFRWFALRKNTFICLVITSVRAWSTKDAISSSEVSSFLLLVGLYLAGKYARNLFWLSEIDPPTDLCNSQAMINVKIRSFGPAMKKGLFRQFQQYPQPICQSQVKFPLPWISTKPDKPYSMVRRSRLETRIYVGYCKVLFE